MSDDTTSQNDHKPPCPICGKPTAQEFRPFCSKRCANVDLQRWFSGRYAVPTADEDEAERPEMDGSEE